MPGAVGETRSVRFQLFSDNIGSLTIDGAALVPVLISPGTGSGSPSFTSTSPIAYTLSAGWHTIK